MKRNQDYKFYINRNRCLILKDKDVEILQLLAIHGVLTKKQLNYYSCTIHGQNEVALKKKFERWRDAKVLVSGVYGEKKRLYYQLGPNGKEILVNLDLFNLDQIKEVSVPRNKDHFFGIRDIVIKILVELRQSNIEGISYSPYSLVYKEEEASGRVVVRPDWIIKAGGQYYNIELDTGSEGMASIRAKIEKWIQLAKLRPNENHHVLFTVIDNVDSALAYMFDDYGVKRNSRVLNLKKMVLTLNAHSYPNLKFTVAQISRMHLIAKRWINRDYMNHADILQEKANLIRHDLTLNPTFKYIAEMHIDPNEIYYYDVDPSLYADANVLLRSAKTNETKVMMIKVMHEGDVYTLDRLGYLNLLKRQNRLKRKVDYIVGVYKTDEELKKDVLDKFENVVLLSEKQLAQDKFKLD